MRLAAIALSMALGLLVGASVEAQESVGRGVGTATCAQFRELSGTKVTDTGFTSWAQGFMTGWNFALRPGAPSRNLSALEVSTQDFLIREYCDKNPLHLYVQAVMAVYFQLPELEPKPE